jgi:two-component SAPR family response regulator
MADGFYRNLRFGPFEFSSRERVLRRDGVMLPLGGRAFDILIYLAERPGEVIAKQELLDRVWSDVTVEEGSIRVHVFAIRKALGDGQFGNSTSHFSRSFKQAFGEPPHAYLVRRRLERVCHLMIISSASLSEIALSVGFSDQAHLGRLLRKTFGQSPSG